MTCIIGYLDRKTNDIFMGSDSAGVDAYFMQKRLDEKVFIKDGMIFGFCGSFRMGQILRYSFKIPEKEKSMDDYEYLCGIFIDSLIECFKDKGFAVINNNEVTTEGSFLVGFNGSLYQIGNDFQVAKHMYDFDSVGSAGTIALGALSILEKLDIEPEIKVFTALYSTLNFSCQVSAPFNVLKLSSDKKAYVIKDPFLVSGLNPSRTNNKLDSKLGKRTH